MSQPLKPNGSTIFVTGVNGHIGNHIVRDLLANGYSVKGSVRDINDPQKTKHVQKHASDLGLEAHLEIVEGDVLDADGWHEHLTGCDGLFHTATVYATSGDASTIIDTANKGTHHLLSAAKNAGIKRVIYTSSIAAVGSTPKGQTKTEQHWQTERSSPYTIAKTESERLAWKLAERFDLDLRVINPGGVLGGGFVKPTPSVEWFDDAMKGRFPAAPKIPMAFVHVKDVAVAHRKAFEVDEAAGRFIVAPHNNSTIAAVCKRIRELHPSTKSPKRAIPVSLMPIIVFQDWMMSWFGAPRRMTRKAVKGYFRGDADLSSDKATNVLGMEWHSFDACIDDTVREFL
jgi:dihydroflavonol-4-reductase